MRRAVTNSPNVPAGQSDLMPENLVHMTFPETTQETKPAIRDWSNIAFAVSFCEKSRRDYDELLAS